MLRPLVVIAMTLSALVLAAANSSAQNQDRPLTEVLPQLYFDVSRREARAFFEVFPFADFVQEEVENALIERLRLSQNIISLAGNQLSSFPLAAASGGFTWDGRHRVGRIHAREQLVRADFRGAATDHRQEAAELWRQLSARDVRPSRREEPSRRRDRQLLERASVDRRPYLFRELARLEGDDRHVERIRDLRGDGSIGYRRSGPHQSCGNASKSLGNADRHHVQRDP